jgi:hypothetical protein
MAAALCELGALVLFALTRPAAHVSVEKIS